MRVIAVFGHLQPQRSLRVLLAFWQGRDGNGPGPVGAVTTAATDGERILRDSTAPDPTHGSRFRPRGSRRPADGKRLHRLTY
ncbi:hypothetical protein EVAR_39428_1 [Eumeta japonica]|uniref:Uncharacterized protein n=1 Tax=Eumeta variegata TaxID=151549 RepID=A0A4C1W000_EUMVA|nr:hypothetical protein EVAR_39428_1 [Eumeta japonica]